MHRNLSVLHLGGLPDETNWAAALARSCPNLRNLIIEEIFGTNRATR
jgi:hypothetical protein